MAMLGWVKVIIAARGGTWMASGNRLELTNREGGGVL